MFSSPGQTDFSSSEGLEVALRKNYFDCTYSYRRKINDEYLLKNLKVTNRILTYQENP